MLNQGQTQAKSLFKQFLFDDKQKYFCIDSAAGMGKSFLLNHLHDEMVDMNKQLKFMGKGAFREMIFTATTNKASSVLNNAQTIHKLLGLRVYDNYKTGKSSVKTSSKTMNIGNSIIVVDEASMIPPEIRAIIDQYTQGSKVVFVGDSYQLAPVNYSAPIVFNQGYPTALLDEPMRQDSSSHLYQGCLQLREGVKGQFFNNVTQGEGIRFVNGDTFKKEILQAFENQEDARVLAYTNKMVENLNGFVRKNLHNTTDFRVGDPVIAASACEGKTKIEETYHIRTMSEPYDDGVMMVRSIELDHSNEQFKIPVDKQAYFRMVKSAKAEAKQDGDWVYYFSLINAYLDIRDGFACTINKSQGSTYDKVFLDFSNVSVCRDLNTLLRLLYVAVSRAKSEVVVYGM